MNFIKKNFKHVLMGTTLFFFVLMLGLGIGLSAVGMGIESQRFISSVEKTIDNYIPAGKVVIDGKTDLYDIAIFNLKSAYVTDVLSTLTEEQKNDSKIEKFWTDYANASFDARWSSVTAAKADIDINEFSHALVAFDVQVAKEFHDYGFTHSGIKWSVSNGALAQLWSSDYTNTAVYQEAKQNQTIIDQAAYQTGTYLVNNKVWFINQQIDLLVYLAIPGGPFKDVESVKNTLITKDKDDKDVPVQVQVNDLYTPKYTNAFEQTRIGSIFLIILTPIFGVIFIAANLAGFYYFKNKK